jgi:hypothetical protein
MTEHKIKPVGSYAEIWHGTALRSPGGLKKKDLMKHKSRIISRKKHAAGKKAIKHLFALGYKPTKGKFTLMRKSMVNGRRRRQTRKRGGANMPANASTAAPVAPVAHNASAAKPVANAPVAK